MPLTIGAATPDAALAAEITKLAAHIEGRTGGPPLSDQTLTRLTDSGIDHLLAYEGTRLVGYAHVDGASAELAAEPAALSTLLAAAEAAQPLARALDAWRTQSSGASA